MQLSGKRVGFALTGSFCTFDRAFVQAEALKAAGCDLYPILSFNAATLDTRFMPAKTVTERLQTICGRDPLATLNAVEPIGPKQMLDLLIICPATGNTLSKLAHGMADTPVTLAAKSHLRNAEPVLLAVSTNDGLAAAAENIGTLLARRHYFFVPFAQDDPKGKPRSLVADMERVVECAEAALNGEQLARILW